MSGSEEGLGCDDKNIALDAEPAAAHKSSGGAGGTMRGKLGRLQQKVLVKVGARAKHDDDPEFAACRTRLDTLIQFYMTFKRHLTQLEQMFFGTAEPMVALSATLHEFYVASGDVAAAEHGNAFRQTAQQLTRGHIEFCNALKAMLASVEVVLDELAALRKEIAARDSLALDVDRCKRSLTSLMERPGAAADKLRVAEDKYKAASAHFASTTEELMLQLNELWQSRLETVDDLAEQLASAQKALYAAGATETRRLVLRPIEARDDSSSSEEEDEQQQQQQQTTHADVKAVAASEKARAHVTMAVPKGRVLAVAKYDSKVQTAKELEFSKGDVITVLGIPTDGDWWKAELAGRKGWVPKSFMQLVEEETEDEATAAAPRLYPLNTVYVVAEQELAAAADDDDDDDDALACAAGDVIEVTAIDGDVWRGRRFGAGADAAFPRAAVRVIQQRDVRVMHAVYAYDATEADELSLAEGELVLVLVSGDGAEWWLGTKLVGGDGFIGSFPYNFVAPATVRRAVATYAYAAREATELSFDAGDELAALDAAADDDWFIGQLADGVFGEVPATHVRFLDHDDEEEEEEEQEEEEEEEEAAAAVKTKRHSRSTSLLEAAKHKPLKVPPTEPDDDDASASSEEAMDAATAAAHKKAAAAVAAAKAKSLRVKAALDALPAKTRTAFVEFDYEAAEDGELSLTAGEVVVLEDDADNDDDDDDDDGAWLHGYVLLEPSRRGEFPSTFVKLMPTKAKHAKALPGARKMPGAGSASFDPAALKANLKKR